MIPQSGCVFTRACLSGVEKVTASSVASPGEGYGAPALACTPPPLWRPLSDQQACAFLYIRATDHCLNVRDLLSFPVTALGTPRRRGVSVTGPAGAEASLQSRL